MNETQLVKWINELLKEHKIVEFYKSSQWRKLRAEILHKHHNECYMCRQSGKITSKSISPKAGRVKGLELHHIYHIDEYPHWALSEYVIDEQGNKVMNLVPLCVAHHLEAHPEKTKKAIDKRKSDKKKKLEQEIPEKW